MALLLKWHGLAVPPGGEAISVAGMIGNLIPVIAASRDVEAARRRAVRLGTGTVPATRGGGVERPVTSIAIV